MTRKRLTQVFPCLLPLRTWQRKKYYYLKMYLDKNQYASTIQENRLPYEFYHSHQVMVNVDSGSDILYQYNKVHNLKLAAKKLNGLLIKPGEIFSLCLSIKDADKEVPYKDGLVLVNNVIFGEYGGGLCQISHLLFWVFLHTPLTIIERHGHPIESFPTTAKDLPEGVDATIAEGWLDLKVKNNTTSTFQIEIDFDETCIYGRILSDTENKIHYHIYNEHLSYYRENEHIYQKTSVDCIQTEIATNQSKAVHLYDSICEIGYELPKEIEIVEKGA